MESYINEIRKALEVGLYHLGLSATLVLPDICGAMQSNNGLANNYKYKKWFNKYVAKKYRGTLTAEECYNFRCSFLHQGSTQHFKSEYSRILFVVPNGQYILHGNIINDALNLDVMIFCEDVLCGVEQWLENQKENPNFHRNYVNFFKRYPNGIPPYISGVPVLS